MGVALQTNAPLDGLDHHVKNVRLSLSVGYNTYLRLTYRIEYYTCITFFASSLCYTTYILWTLSPMYTYE